MIKSFSAVLFSILMLWGTGGFAQTQKGNFTLSGKTDLNFLFSNKISKTDSVRTGKMNNTQYGCFLGAGYFIADNLSIGISGIYLYTYTRTEFGFFGPDNENITNTFGIIPQVTYYFPLEGKLKPFVSAGAGYLWSNERDSKSTSNNNEVFSSSGLSINGAAGVSYFINDWVAFDIGMQYSHARLKMKDQPSQTQIGNTIAGSLGISVFF